MKTFFYIFLCILPISINGQNFEPFDETICGHRIFSRSKNCVAEKNLYWELRDTSSDCLVRVIKHDQYDYYYVRRNLKGDFIESCFINQSSIETGDTIPTYDQYGTIVEKTPKTYKVKTGPYLFYDRRESTITMGQYLQGYKEGKWKYQHLMNSFIRKIEHYKKGEKIRDSIIDYSILNDNMILSNLIIGLWKIQYNNDTIHFGLKIDTIDYNIRHAIKFQDNGQFTIQTVNIGSQIEEISIEEKKGTWNINTDCILIIELDNEIQYYEFDYFPKNFFYLLQHTTKHQTQ